MNDSASEQGRDDDRSSARRGDAGRRGAGRPGDGPGDRRGAGGARRRDDERSERRDGPRGRSDERRGGERRGGEQRGDGRRGRPDERRGDDRRPARGDSRDGGGRPTGGRPAGPQQGRKGAAPSRPGRPASRPTEKRPRVVEPEIAEDASIGQLGRDVRGRLRGLTKENAERIGLHLVMAGRLLDVDPERAYEHTQAAVRRGGRVDVVREAAGIAAYRTGRFAEALRELRTVRRLNGSSEHLPLMADAERGLGRPERALALAASEEARTLDAEGRTELAIVASGARSDLGEHDAALAVLDRIPAAERRGDLGLRVLQARAAALEAAGRDDDAARLLAGVDPAELERASGVPQEPDDVVVYDTYDEEADEPDTEGTEPTAEREPEAEADAPDAGRA